VYLLVRSTLIATFLLAWLLLIELSSSVLVVLSEELTNTLNLEYDGRVMLTIAGSYIERILGIPAGNSLREVNIGLEYSVLVNVTLNNYLELESCSLELVVREVTSTPTNEILDQVIRSVVNTTGIIVKDYCKKISSRRVLTLPLLLELNHGQLRLREIPSSTEFVGIARLDIDLVVSVEEITIKRNKLLNSTWRHLYYEPLTGIPVYYSELTTYSNLREFESYTYFTYVELVEHANRLAHYVKRTLGVYEIQANSSMPEIEARGNTLVISFSNETRCFLLLGQIPLWVNVSISGISATRYELEDTILIYTPSPVRCLQVEITLSTLVRESEESAKEFPEKCLPPRRLGPSTADLALSFTLVTLTVLLSYFVVAKLANYITRKPQRKI
jgi:hypothetical protein